MICLFSLLSNVKSNMNCNFFGKEFIAWLNDCKTTKEEPKFGFHFKEKSFDYIITYNMHESGKLLFKYFACHDASLLPRLGCFSVVAPHRAKNTFDTEFQSNCAIFGKVAGWRLFI